jgi:hypothetical protein
MKYLAVVVVVIILIIAFGYHSKRNTKLQMVEGIWKGNRRFLEDAGLTSCTMYVSALEHGKRHGYLVMENEDGIITNQRVMINESFSAKTIMGYTNASVKWSLCFDEPFRYIPQHVICTFVTDGTMTLYDDDKVYLSMEKDVRESKMLKEHMQS